MPCHPALTGYLRSVTLDASSVEFNGNTITGSSTCINGTVIVPGEPPDPPSNTCS